MRGKTTKFLMIFVGFLLITLCVSDVRAEVPSHKRAQDVYPWPAPSIRFRSDITEMSRLIKRIIAEVRRKMRELALLNERNKLKIEENKRKTRMIQQRIKEQNRLLQDKMDSLSYKNDLQQQRIKDIQARNKQMQQVIQRKMDRNKAALENARRNQRNKMAILEQRMNSLRK